MAACVDELLVVQRLRPVRVGVALGLLVTVEFFVSSELLLIVIVSGIVAGVLLVGYAAVHGPRRPPPEERAGRRWAWERPSSWLGGAARRTRCGSSSPVRPTWAGRSGRPTCPATWATPWATSGTTSACGARSRPRSWPRRHRSSAATGDRQHRHRPIWVWGCSWSWWSGRSGGAGTGGSGASGPWPSRPGRSASVWAPGGGVPWSVFYHLPLFSNVVQYRFAAVVVLCASVHAGHHRGPHPHGGLGPASPQPAVPSGRVAPTERGWRRWRRWRRRRWRWWPWSRWRRCWRPMSPLVRPTGGRADLVPTHGPPSGEGPGARSPIPSPPPTPSPPSRGRPSTGCPTPWPEGAVRAGTVARAGADAPGFAVLRDASVPLLAQPVPTASTLAEVRKAMHDWGVTTVVVPDDTGLPEYQTARGDRVTAWPSSPPCSGRSPRTRTGPGSGRMWVVRRSRHRSPPPNSMPASGPVAGGGNDADAGGEVRRPALRGGVRRQTGDRAGHGVMSR